MAKISALESLPTVVQVKGLDGETYQRHTHEEIVLTKLSTPRPSSQANGVCRENGKGHGDSKYRSSEFSGSRTPARYSDAIVAILSSSCD